MSLRRHHPQGVLPLEVWDVLVDATPLYLLPDGELPAAIARVVLCLRDGTARRLRAHATLPQLAIEHVVLTGGGPTRETQAALTSVGLSASVADDPVWICESGGRALLSRAWPAARGAVMEVGQTSIKYSDGQGRVRVSRPLSQVPIESEARHLSARDLRRRTLEFLASVPLQRVRPEALVLALPCEIDDQLRVAGCSYPWPTGDSQLIEDFAVAAQLTGVPMLVLNDAELAAVAVQHVGAPTRGTLVLTLGLGLGGAFVAQSDAASASSASSASGLSNVPG